MKQGNFNIFLTALYALRVNRLRAVITILIIALGITSLVGMQTAIEGLKWSLVNNLNSLGNNTFSITKTSSTLKMGHGFRSRESPPEITYRQATKFKKVYSFAASVSVSARAMSDAKARFKKIETNPNIPIIGGDQHYLISSGFSLEAGRNFTPTEIEKGANVAIIGRELNDLLFSPEYLGIGQSIYLADRRYTVIGVTVAKGSSFGASYDKSAVIPLLGARKNFAQSMATDYSIKVTVDDVFLTDAAISEALGTMRVIRGLKPGADTNFGITKSDSLQVLLEKNLSYVSYAALVIGLITLLGALISLMNIMFVTVTERTREIGTRMAVGASSASIKFQFLSEASIISVIGGIVGIIIGVLIGNLVGVFLNLDPNLPVQWILISVVLCLIVGISAGFLPAQKASNLDPIESLRYE